MNRWVYVGALSVAGALVAVACGGGAAAPTATRAPATAGPVASANTPTAAPTKAPTAVPTRVPAVGKVTAALASLGNEKLLPQKANVQSDSEGFRLYTDPLINMAPDGSLIPWLATAWTLRSDGIEVALRKGVKFHNGDPLTAADVKFTFEEVMKQANGNIHGGIYRTIIDPAKGIEIKDDHSLFFHSTGPFPAFAAHQINQYENIIPKAYWEKVGEEGYKAAPVGTGPFKFVRHSKGVSWEWQSNQEWWNTPASYKDLEIKIIADATTRLAALKTGEVDIISGVAASQRSEVEKTPGLKAIVLPDTAAGFYAVLDLYWPEPSPLKDQRVREALELAVDRDAICGKVYYGLCRPTTSIFHPFTPGWNKDLKPRPYDPAKAKALMQQAGYPNGFETQLIYFGDASRDQAVADYWAAIGVKTKLVAMELGSWVRNWTTHQPTMRGLSFTSSAGYSGGPHPTGHIHMIRKGEAWSYYNNDELSALYTGLQKITDQAEYLRVTKQIQDMVYADLPMIVNMELSSVGAIGPRVREYKPIPGWSSLTNLESIQLVR